MDECFRSKAKSAAEAFSTSSRVVLLFFLLLLLGTFVSFRWIDTSFFSFTTTPAAFPFPCGNLTSAATSSHSATTSNNATKISSPALNQTLHSPLCPDYFRWIHEDLRPWSSTGITREAVNRAARGDAHFRLVVVSGKAYVERFHGAFQSRDVLTLWGLLQLMRRYPGRVPDLELIFNMEDMPAVRSSDYRGPNATSPPPLFKYCKDDTTLDIVFPDWSFWGWPEVNIKPWEVMMAEMREGNKKVRWDDREPYAYWKGNPDVAQIRQELVKCNVSKDKDWGARIYGQDWAREMRNGFKGSDLTRQCLHRYKIYVEGRSWSVSQKYILACDSPVLQLTTRFQEFFTRGLVPGQHYWPIGRADTCGSIKFAIQWGEAHQKEMQAVGKEGSSFTQEQLKMDYVYDYMLHLLTEYAKLMRYKPSKSEKAVELGLDYWLFHGEGRVKECMMESMVRSPHPLDPCAMPHPFDPVELKELLTRKENLTNQVAECEQKARESQKAQESQEIRV